MTTQLQRQRIAILGCGYVGSAVGRALADAGHEVTATTTTPAREPIIRDLGLTPAVIHLAETERLGALLADRDIVYLTVAAGRRRGHYRNVYLDGVRNLLSVLDCAPVSRVIYTSSTAVYGQQDGSWVDEASPTEPADPNGLLLLETERTLLEGVENLRTNGWGKHLPPEAENQPTPSPISATVLRLSGIYGPGRDPTKWIERSAGQRRADGDGYLNLIHLDDIVTALVQLLDVPYHGVLNLSDDRPTTRREFYDRLLAAAGLPPIRWVRPADPPDLGKRIRNDLVKRILGLTLKHPTH